MIKNRKSVPIKRRLVVRFVASMMVFIMMFVFQGSVSAASTSKTGSLGGYSTSATLSMSNSSATGTTSSAIPSNATHYVSVQFTYYYTDSSGATHQSHSSGSDYNSYIAVATAYGSGNTIRAINSSSYHKVTYSGSTWSWHLYL